MQTRYVFSFFFLRCGARCGRKQLRAQAVACGAYRAEGTSVAPFSTPSHPLPHPPPYVVLLFYHQGCYATGSQLALAPLVRAGLVRKGASPRIFGVSGYSGAGTTPSPKNDPAVLKDNLIPYALTGHIHEREVSAQLGVPVTFMPHVAPHFRGISLTVSADLASPIDGSGVHALYEEFYRGEPLVKVHAAGYDETPLVQDIANEHHVALGGFIVDEAQEKVVVLSCIDNLLKGAATQAVQNANLILGLPELEGIPAK